ncbi:energy transducer TonB [Tunturibacter empetritectus]|uniref:Outer membrane biosynthesis protein TonB n=1 Tax=Tunturiibacter lichenicola TaxID=2051959 RepID=A0A7W8J6H9_9BACT|nr:energy transducer TonB [Edaphobacter lichenicola]MBB5343583.1 outer membrane biosynthesis protein TonB [Edaphobacter lichenicola]
MACSLEPVFIDDKVQGRITVHVVLQVGTDGTVEMANVEKSPSDALTQKIHDQMMTWLFEPPTKEGQPIRIKTESDIAVNVIHPK